MKRILLMSLLAILLPMVVKGQNTETEVIVTPTQITEIVQGSKGNIQIEIPDDIARKIYNLPGKSGNSISHGSGNSESTASGSNSGTGSKGNQTHTADNKGGKPANAQTGNKGQTASNNQQGKNSGTGKTLKKTEGFRIQVFSDAKNPQTLQARARARGNQVVARFPKYRGQVYTFSSSPNWFTRVGNFETNAEASKALSELKAAFPQFAGEMRIVKSTVTIRK